jgi:alkyldihydroxyacetonephosphate synthase
MGVKTMPASIVEHWMGNRNVVPSWDMLLSRNLIADTVEVSADWDQIGKVYDDAIASLNQVEGIRAASAHSSHVYRSGLNLYFTFAVQLESPEAMEPTYFDCWRRIMEATVRHGGSLAHHHGIGRVRRDMLADELGAGGLGLLRKIKQALDPNGIMNPGVLIPDA